MSEEMVATASTVKVEGDKWGTTKEDVMQLVKLQSQFNALKTQIAECQKRITDIAIKNATKEFFLMGEKIGGLKVFVNDQLKEVTVTEVVVV